MNLIAAIVFLPAAGALRALAGLPAGDQSLYLAMVSMFVLIFGVGYFWAAWAGHVERLFIALATGGKLTFFTLLVWFWTEGSLPARSVLMGTGDFVFGVLFLAWLSSTQPAVGQLRARS